MMTEKVEQHICIKFCQKVGHSSSETYDIIQKAFGNEAMGCTQVKEWFRHFKEGWTSAESDEHSGRPSTSRNQVMIDKVLSAMLDNRRITIRELSDEMGLSFGLIQSILTEDLGMKYVSAKFVPKLLTVGQKETRLAVARDLL
jgi:AraC-like DNA-binding protein